MDVVGQIDHDRSLSAAHRPIMQRSGREDVVQPGR